MGVDFTIRKKGIVLLAIAVMLCLCGLCSISASAGKRETVRVAYFNLGEYYQTAEGERGASYDYEYLKKIAEYSGLEFEYVDCGSWENALDMLDQHKVDLVGTVQQNAAREEKYSFCQEHYGYTVGELVALPESDYIYEDYAAIGSAVIGCTSDYVRMEELKKVFEREHISPQIRYYEKQQDLKEALETGEVDMVAANSHTLSDSLIVVEKFSYTPFYFVSWKENVELTNAISEALVEINLYEPSFESKLMEEYFEILIGTPYTKKEYGLINEKKQYRVYFDTTTKPLSFEDEKAGEMSGVLIDLCRLLGDVTGLELQTRARMPQQQVDDTTVTYRTLYYNSADSARAEKGVTNALLDEYFNLYHKAGEPYELNGAYSIAIVWNRDGIEEYIHEKYPKCSIVEYKTPLECVIHVNQDDVDLAFLNTHVAESVLKSKNITHIEEMPTKAVNFGIALQFHGENRQELADIVNKGLKLIGEDTVDELRVQYALDTSPEIDLTYVVTTHPVISMLIIVLLAVLVVVSISSYIYAESQKREKEHIQNADQARADFFARMSHDMRTPMNGILGMASLSEQEEDVEVLKRNMGKVRESGTYLLGLINDTLDLQKIESGKLELDTAIEKGSVLIDSVAEMVRQTAKEKMINFTVQTKNVELDSYVKCDALRVKQVFINLLSNAVKFTAKGGEVRLIVERIGQEEKILHEKIQVKDTGVGISPEYIRNGLFTAYSQEKNEMTAKYAGSGLGLAITKSLVELMGGSIEVVSELGEGTTFTVYLDLERVDEEVAKKQKQQKREISTQALLGLAGKHILLCEDHPLNAEIATRLLERMQCAVTWAENGKAGVTAFEKSALKEYDVILMDIRMPVMNGLDAARAIRGLAREDAAVIPIIAMTANAYDEDRKKSKEAGMNAHLAKPIVPEILFATILQVLDQK